MGRGKKRGKGAERETVPMQKLTFENLQNEHYFYLLFFQVKLSPIPDAHLIEVEPLPYQINPRSPHFLGNKKVFCHSLFPSLTAAVINCQRSHKRKLATEMNSTFRHSIRGPKTSIPLLWDLN